MPTLELQLSESMNRSFFLAGYKFSPADIKLNTTPFQWYMRMPSIFDQHREIAEKTTVQFQDFLKVK